MPSKVKNARGDGSSSRTSRLSPEPQLARLGVEVSPAAGREWGDNDANRSVRKALNGDLEKLADVYGKRTKRIYAEIASATQMAEMFYWSFAGFALLLAATGIVLI